MVYPSGMMWVEDALWVAKGHSLLKINSILCVHLFILSFFFFFLIYEQIKGVFWKRENIQPS